jgi:hypothetical protein
LILEGKKVMGFNIPDGWEVNTSKREQKNEVKEKGRERFYSAKESGTYSNKPDYGRTSVYRAEWRALKELPDMRVPMTLKQIEDTVNMIIADDRVKIVDPYSGEKVTVEDTCRNGAIAYPYQRRIRFGTEKNMYAVLHEVAHILNPADGHTRQFCITQCDLIGWFIGPKSGAIMAKHLGVRY